MTADYHYQQSGAQPMLLAGESLAGHDNLREPQEDVLSMHSA